MLNLRFTNQFKKDFKLAQKRGFDLSEFESIINKLRNRKPLEEKYNLSKDEIDFIEKMIRPMS